MNAILDDIRYALRGFGKSPLFTGVAILSLALGIGANTSIFTLLDQVMLRLLPVKKSTATGVVPHARTEIMTLNWADMDNWRWLDWPIL